MGTAANAPSHSAKESTEDDEWDVFEKDIANSLGALELAEWQRRAKYAINPVSKFSVNRKGSSI